MYYSIQAYSPRHPGAPRNIGSIHYSQLNFLLAHLTTIGIHPDDVTLTPSCP